MLSLEMSITGNGRIFTGDSGTGQYAFGTVGRGDCGAGAYDTADHYNLSPLVGPVWDEGTWAVYVAGVNISSTKYVIDKSRRTTL